MIQAKNTILLLLATAVLVLAGCASSTNQAAQLNEPTIETIPPEPTNTPLPQAQPAAAGDLCSVAGQHAQIDEAFAAYRVARGAEANAVLELSEWANTVSSEIATACNAAAFELSAPDELADLLDKLQSGGYIIYVRHTHTDRSRGDDDVSLGMCDTQRILSDQGRDEAILIRNAYQILDLPVDKIVSTQYCRTLETAVLAFGVPRVVSRTDLHATLTERLATEPEVGTNTIIVAHIGTIRDRVGLADTFEEGDSLVYRPNGDGGFEFVGRIGLYDWPVLAALSQSQGQ